MLCFQNLEQSIVYHVTTYLVAHFQHSVMNALRALGFDYNLVRF